MRALPEAREGRHRAAYLFAMLRTNHHPAMAAPSHIASAGPSYGASISFLSYVAIISTAGAAHHHQMRNILRLAITRPIQECSPRGDCRLVNARLAALHRETSFHRCACNLSSSLAIGISRHHQNDIAINNNIWPDQRRHKPGTSGITSLTIVAIGEALKYHLGECMSCRRKLGVFEKACAAIGHHKCAGGTWPCHSAP